MNIVVNLPEGETPTQGKILTFRSPTSGTDTDYLIVNGEEYLLVGADTYETCYYFPGWEEGALLTVSLDIFQKRAYVLNAVTNYYLERQLEMLRQGINRIALPTQMGTLTYNGQEQSPQWWNEYSSAIELTSGGSGTDAGTYIATWEIVDTDYYWEDGTQDPQYVEWKITPATVGFVPFQSGTLEYTGSAQSPEWRQQEGETTVSGTTSATDAGTYYATFTPASNYMWSDSTTEPREIPWYIQKAVVAVPTQSGTLTYNNTDQLPSWSGYDSTKMTVSQTASKHAGEYTATFTTTSNYCFSCYGYGANLRYDTSKTASWAIGVCVLSLSVSPTSLSLDAENDTGEITLTHNGYADGNLTFVGSAGNTSGIQCTVDENLSKMTIKATKTFTGDVEIEPVMTEYLDYSLAARATVAVTANMVDSTLANNSWATIHAISAAGQAANYWAAGDGKDVVINGTVNGVSLNDTITAYILGINHNAAQEGNNLTHFCLGRSDGIEIALTGGAGFKMNNSSRNSGGWQDSVMRKTTLGNSGTPDNPPSGSLLSILPSDLLTVLQPVSKYTAEGSSVSQTTDYLFLMSEKEGYGKTQSSNSQEGSYQQQYAYYAAGNSRTRYRNTLHSQMQPWWLRSPQQSSTANFCVSTAPAGSAAAGQSASNQNGMVACFCI